MNLEKGYGATADEVASCIGEDITFDERVTQVSPERFEIIMSAFKKKAFFESKTALKELLSPGGKVFKDTNDYYLVDKIVVDITIEAFEYGSFRIPGEKSSREKAEQGKKDLMLYLIEINSPDADALSGITLNKEEEPLTLIEFINSKKESVREEFFSYRQEKYKAYRFNRIFSHIRGETKSMYESFRKDEASRVKKDEFLLSTTQKINIITENMNRLTEQRTKAIKDIANANKEKAQYTNTLTQKHNFFHKK